MHKMMPEAGSSKKRRWAVAFEDISCHKTMIAKQSRMGELLASEKLSDVVIHVGGETIKAHSAILAVGSPVLMDILESSSSRIIEVSCSDASTMRQLVKYMYSGELDFTSDEQCEKLMVAAHEYRVDLLMRCCEQYLESQLSFENAIEYLQLATKVGNLKFQFAARAFVVANAMQLRSRFGNAAERLAKLDSQQLAQLVLACSLSPELARARRAMQPSREQASTSADGQGAPTAGAAAMSCRPMPPCSGFIRSSSSAIKTEQGCGHLIEALLASRQHSDLTIFVAEQQIPAHKLVLVVRSPVFAALFQQQQQQQQQTQEHRLHNQLHIGDLQPDAVKALLRYMYVGKVEERLSDAALCGLLLAADKYAVEGLKTVCQRRMLEQLRTENALDFLRLATKLGVEPLRQGARDFVLENAVFCQNNDIQPLGSLDTHILVDLVLNFAPVIDATP